MESQLPTSGGGSIGIAAHEQTFSKWKDFIKWRSEKIRAAHRSKKMVGLRKSIERKQNEYSIKQREKIAVQEHYDSLNFIQKLFISEPRNRYVDYLDSDMHGFEIRFIHHEMQSILDEVPEVTVENYLNWLNGIIK